MCAGKSLRDEYLLSYFDPHVGERRVGATHESFSSHMYIYFTCSDVIRVITFSTFTN